jgi:hypothetical protein
MSTTSSTEKAKWSCDCCGRTARRRACSRAESASSGPPSIATVPADGASSPVATRRSVVFPAPLGPTTAVSRPGRTAAHGNRILGEDPERLSFQSIPGDAQTPTLTHIPAQMGENGS